MEEGEYKTTYDELASVPCVFEKALTNHKATCSLSKHFCLADREGYACRDKGSSIKCSELLSKLRQNSTFALKLQDISGPLPHNMEIRVQAGGITGLGKLLNITLEAPDDTLDIKQTLSDAVDRYGALEDLPYGEIIQSVMQFQGRRKRQR